VITVGGVSAWVTDDSIGHAEVNNLCMAILMVNPSGGGANSAIWLY
jgi:hypothetical protein